MLYVVGKVLGYITGEELSRGTVFGLESVGDTVFVLGYNQGKVLIYHVNM